jgi:hypothetical protein
MLENELILTVLIIILTINSFLAGYVLGGRHSIKHSQDTTGAPRSFFQKQQKKEIQNNIEIDNKKFVGNINTDKLEKKYSSLGETKTSTENISSSINMLKNLKK